MSWIEVPVALLTLMSADPATAVSKDESPLSEVLEHFGQTPVRVIAWQELIARGDGPECCGEN